MAPIVQSIALAFPPHVLPAAQAAGHLREIFAAQGEDPELVSQVIANSGIQTRHLAREPAFYLAERSLTARNRAYGDVARELGVAAVRDALARAEVRPGEVDLIVDTSCTGVLIPALDASVANALGFRPDVRRIPLTEVGCAAGATSLALAADLLRARGGGVAVCLAVELPSLTFQLADPTRANLVSAALFGDGAAALVVADRPPPRLSFAHEAHATHLFPHSEDVMGFDLRTEGFHIVLSRRIPLLVKRELRALVDAFLVREGRSLAELGFFILHPGGTKVLDNLRDVLGLDEAQVTASRACLARYGNLSSASVHVVAHDLLAAGAIEPERAGLLIAMGPGFTVELALLRAVGPR